MATTDPAGEPAAVEQGVNTRGVVQTGVWLGVSTLVVAGLMFGLFRWLDRSEKAVEKPLAPEIAASLKRTPPEPRLEPYPLLPRQLMRAEEDAILGSYGWAEKSAGFARIPIDRAMELIVQRGLPPSKPMAAGAPPPPAPAPSMEPPR